MSWRTLRRGFRQPLNPSGAEEPTTQAELYILKVPVDGEQLVGAGGRRLNPAARAASRIIAALQGLVRFLVSRPSRPPAASSPPATRTPRARGVTSISSRGGTLLRSSRKQAFAACRADPGQLMCSKCATTKLSGLLTGKACRTTCRLLVTYGAFRGGTARSDV
jgi:hypothetical protein